MDKSLKILLWILAVVVLILIFFYPKYAGYGYGGYVPMNTTLHREEQNCFGIKYSTYGDRFHMMQCADCGPTYWCSGIPYGNACYEWVSGEPMDTEREYTCGIGIK